VRRAFFRKEARDETQRKPGGDSMKRVIGLIPVILLSSFTARAQETTSAWELSGGYSYMEADLNGTRFHMNGFNASGTQNVNSWFGGRIEVNGYLGNEPQTVSGTTTVYSVSAATITYGPVFSYRKYSRITPFAHVQIGAVHGSTNYLGISQHAFKFAAAPGAGVDFALNRSTAIRVEGEYLLTRFLGLTQQNADVSVGLVWRFGRTRGGK
jgi:opacity protein-like surface antigen